MIEQQTMNALDIPIVVLKFGGTSLADSERICNSAKRVIASREAGSHIVVVVSAMAGETDRLLDMGMQFGPALNDPRQREFDALVSSGEQISAALMAMALQEQGIPALSLTAPQIKIHTDGRFQRARIRSIDTNELLSTLMRGTIAVVTGFQGIDHVGNVVTLGRGGSDTTGVALAVALGAKKCEIYTDVEGIYTADPSVIPDARKLRNIFFEEMIELASSGAGVLQIRSVELAMKYGMEIHVRSSFSEKEGTRVITKEKELEALVVTGVAHDDDQAKVTIVGLDNRPDILARVLEPLASYGIVLDLITQNIGVDGRMTVTFTLNDDDLERTKECLNSQINDLGSPEVRVESGLVKVSVVGIGMRTHAGVAQKVFALLSSKQIPILIGLSTEIKVSCVVPNECRNSAVEILHEGFELHKID